MYKAEDMFSEDVPQLRDHHATCQFSMNDLCGAADTTGQRYLYIYANPLHCLLALRAAFSLPRLDYQVDMPFRKAVASRSASSFGLRFFWYLASCFL